MTPQQQHVNVGQTLAARQMKLALRQLQLALVELMLDVQQFNHAFLIMDLLFVLHFASIYIVLPVLMIKQSVLFAHKVTLLKMNLA